MKNEKTIAALFDFDGVVVDTEPQYTLFWDVLGKKYYPEIESFGLHIKGLSLKDLYQRYFLEEEGLQDEITRQLDAFEHDLRFEFIPGVMDFMRELRQQGVKIAIVTSSSDSKMANAYREHPEIKALADAIITADRVARTKPHPDCFLLAAETLGIPVEHCVVFEDSFHGLEAANRAEMKVVGLATTNPADAIVDKCEVVISDFVGFSYEKMMGVL
jgi:HAD superfamily hydrolase (TIGR01509 family)